MDIATSDETRCICTEKPETTLSVSSLVKEVETVYNGSQRSRTMSGKSSFPYRKYDRRPHPLIVKQILEDSELIEMMKEVLIQEGRACPFCHRKLKGESKAKEIW